MVTSASGEVAPAPVLVAPLLPALHDELISLLRALPTEAWLRRTSAGPWRVRDVAAHLLDGDLRRLSLLRDGYAPSPGRAIAGYADLLEYLNELNATWVRAAQRISPGVLVELLATVGRQSADAMAALDPMAEAAFPVLWAGESASRNWMDIGREYTERWHHQDQIREAVGAPPLADVRWLRPVLEISVHALPRAYAAVDAPAGTQVALRIDGPAGSEWRLQRERRGWTLDAGPAADAACTLSMTDLTAARLLLHRLSRPEAEAGVRIDGDARLGQAFLAARAVMV